MDTLIRFGLNLFGQHDVPGSEHAVEAAGGAHEAAAHHGPSFLGLFVYVALMLIAMFGLMAFAKKGFSKRVFTNPVAHLFEQLYFFIEGLCVGIIGNHGRKYVPMMMVIWLVIFISNMLSLFLSTAPTADLSFNLALALVSIMYVQWEGIRANGFFGHFKHFSGPKLTGPLILISVMIFFIELLSEVMKNVSLSLRLFGNIDGGHQAVEAMNKLGEPFFIPFGSFLLPIKLLTVILQALIFTLLTCVYISLVTHHEEEHEHDQHMEAAPAH